ncbi:MAG: aminotransferase class V-fold PLP-dependent enzyme [Polyangiaceae bacterium]
MSLLMIPGPIEISAAVAAACAGPPPSHLAPAILEAFGSSLEKLRRVWLAAPSAQPFVLPGSGSIAMEVAATNLLDPGAAALVVNTGYFSERMAEMLRRRGVEVTLVGAAPGDAPTTEAVAAALASRQHHALFATHVDTSTGVRTDAAALAKVARDAGVLSVFDGVCATAGEAFEMAAWDADIYLTASQKAIGLPAGLALLVASERAMKAREALKVAPPLSLDLLSWLPIMRAYEERKPSYFATPPTTLIRALPVALDEILAAGMPARFALHARAAGAMRSAWAALGLRLLPKSEGLAANTLSAIFWPEGAGPEVLAEIGKRGVIVAGGLLPALRTQYFRVGHMGDVLNRPEALTATVRAIGESLAAAGIAATWPRGVCARARSRELRVAATLSTCDRLDAYVSRASSREPSCTSLARLVGSSRCS